MNNIIALLIGFFVGIIMINYITFDNVVIIN